MKTPYWIWQYAEWPHFCWNNDSIIASLARRFMSRIDTHTAQLRCLVWDYQGCVLPARPAIRGLKST